MDDFSLKAKFTNAEIMGLKACFGTVSRNFNRGEIITRGSSVNNTMGIITSGTAYLVTTNLDYQRRIIDYYQSGNIFGKYFFPNSEENLYYVIAKTNCSVDFVKYNRLITCCGNNCAKHVQMIDHLIMVTTRKQLMHIDILGQRTLRSKLTSFFEYVKLQKNSKSFTIPLPLSDLADYLAVDRSAMMREIKKMNEENIICSDKRKFTLLY